MNRRSFLSGLVLTAASLGANIIKPTVTQHLDTQSDMSYGLYISAPSEHFIQAAIDELERQCCGEDGSLVIKVPGCGETLHCKTIDDLPRYDVPCTCGNKSHWLIKYRIDSTLDRRT